MKPLSPKQLKNWSRVHQKQVNKFHQLLLKTPRDRLLAWCWLRACGYGYPFARDIATGKDLLEFGDNYRISDRYPYGQHPIYRFFLEEISLNVELHGDRSIAITPGRYMQQVGIEVRASLPEDWPIFPINPPGWIRYIYYSSYDFIDVLTVIFHPDFLVFVGFMIYSYHFTLEGNLYRFSRNNCITSYRDAI